MATSWVWHRQEETLTRPLSSEIFTFACRSCSDNGLNQRIIKRVYGENETLVETRHFYYNDRWQCVEEYVTPAGSANRIAARYFWGLQCIDELTVRWRDSNGNGTLDEVLYAMQDANYNVVALVESNSGESVERFTYDAYGKATVRDQDFSIKQNGNEYAWEYLYTGRRLDRESGLMYYRNRYYHVGLGRFVTRDPIGYEGSPWNLYEYVRNSPTQDTDPSGLMVLSENAMRHRRGRLLIPLAIVPPCLSSQLVLGGVAWADAPFHGCHARASGTGYGGAACGRAHSSSTRAPEIAFVSPIGEFPRLDLSDFVCPS